MRLSRLLSISEGRSPVRRDRLCRVVLWLPIVVWCLAIASTAWSQTMGELNDRASELQKARRYDEALKLYEEAYRIADPNDPDLHVLLGNMGFLIGQIDRNQSERAVALLKRCIALREAQFGLHDDRVADALQTLSLLRVTGRDASKAVADLARAIDIRSRNHPIETYEIIRDIDLLCICYISSGEYENIHERTSSLVENLESRVGPDDGRLRGPLLNLASAKIRRGDYAIAERLIQRAQRLPMAEDKRFESLVRESSTLANLYGQTGRLTEALEHLVREEKIEQARVERYTTAIGNGAVLANRLAQGALLMKLGQPEKAVRYFQEALPAMNRFSPGRGPYTCYSDLGKAYQMLGELERAEEAFRSAILSARDFAGIRALGENDLGNLLIDRGKTEEAERLLVASQEHLKSLRAADRAFLVGWLANHGYLGRLYSATDRPVEAESQFREVLNYDDEATRLNLRDRAKYLLGLAEALERQGKHAEAQVAADQARRIVHEATAKVLPVLADAEQTKFLAYEDEPALQKAIALLRPHFDDAASVRVTADWILNRKGSGLQAAAERVLLAREAVDPALAGVVEDWIAVRHHLSKLSVGDADDKGSPEQRRKNIARLVEREQELAGRLGRANIHQAVDQPWYETTQLRKALPASSAFVDLVRHEPPGGSSKASYFAWVVPPEGRGEVRFVGLGSAAEIEAATLEVRRELEAAPKRIDELGETKAEERLRSAMNRLSRLLLHPLLPSISGFDHWVICPDGAPWLVPWNALTLPEQDGFPGAYVVERYRVNYVISGRDVIKKSPTASGNVPLVFADPDFESPTRESSVATRSADEPWFVRGASRNAGDSIPTNWQPLPGTAVEARFVAPALKAYSGREPDIRLRDQADEPTFKDVWRPRMLLVSTHGFFLEAGGAQALQNPLLRCGLVLAGANRAQLRRQGRDDGIITGMDVLSADLRGTELVVLSACETGVGTVNSGEGVAGLRQAFQLAGAQAVVSTLWRIPDEETAMLMSMFFHQLAAGADKSKALAQAQQAMATSRRKSPGKSSHPYFWAAFTLTGDWRTPEVGPVAVRPQRPPPQPQVEVTVEYAQVMDGSKIAAKVPQGDRMVSGESRGEWLQVFYAPGTGRSGWIRLSDVRRVR